MNKKSRRSWECSTTRAGLSNVSRGVLPREYYVRPLCWEVTINGRLVACLERAVPIVCDSVHLVHEHDVCITSFSRESRTSRRRM